MNINDVDFFFRSVLPIADFAAIDRSPNGLQVTNRSGSVKKIAFAVDACLESFKRAAGEGADMLFVHHGIFWGQERVVTGDYFTRLSFLLDNNLALYAVHLPLDADPLLGNNASAAEKAGLSSLEPFGNYHGVKIGYKGVFSEPLSCQEVLKQLDFKKEDMLSILPFGVEKNKTAAIMTGGASSQVQQAIDENIDLYITGEVSHQIYHPCMEAKINVICAGHYQTETFGVRNMENLVREKLSLDTCFIDIPTGL